MSDQVPTPGQLAAAMATRKALDDYAATMSLAECVGVLYCLLVNLREQIEVHVAEDQRFPLVAAAETLAAIGKRLDAAVGMSHDSCPGFMKAAQLQWEQLMEMTRRDS